MDNDPYKIKLSALRYQVSQELVAASGLLKDTTKLLKAYTETPNLALDKSVRTNILKSGENLDKLNNDINVLRKRIEHIAKNFVGNLQEKEAVENLALDIPQNTQNMSMLKKHYLEIVGIYSKPGKSGDEYLQFTFLQNESESNTLELGLDKKDPEITEDIVIKKAKPKTKKHRLSCF